MTQPNPFAPPSELADRALGAPGYDPRAIRFYSANQVALATFLGSAVAGSLLMAANFRAFGKPVAAWQTIVLGSAATIALLWVSFLLPEGRGFGLPLILVIASRALVSALQGQNIARVIVNGGRKHSTWRATGIALGCLVCIAFLGFVVALLLTDY